LSESENAHVGEDDGSDGETDGDANPMVRAVLLFCFCCCPCRVIPCLVGRAALLAGARRRADGARRRCSTLRLSAQRCDSLQRGAVQGLEHNRTARVPVETEAGRCSHSLDPRRNGTPTDACLRRTSTLSCEAQAIDMGRPLSRRGSYSNVVEHVLGSSDATAQPGYARVIFFLTLMRVSPSLLSGRSVVLRSPSRGSDANRPLRRMWQWGPSMPLTPGQARPWRPAGAARHAGTAAGPGYRLLVSTMAA
jgi:hypothetical protein